MTIPICDHCQEEIPALVNVYLDPGSISWCGTCCRDFRRFLESVQPDMLPSPISEHFSWGRPENVEKVKRIPKRPKMDSIVAPVAASKVDDPSPPLEEPSSFCKLRYYGLQSCSCKECVARPKASMPQGNPFGYSQ